ncbi:MAG TPA: hypothetical protein DD624_08060 [Alphaproteobacteria bacterium]|nr:hypothetical protein [Alphaproteobacteria bacterium]
MNKKPFISLSTKIVLVFFLCLSAMTGALLSVFLQTFVTQSEQERMWRQKKAQILTSMYEENVLLREAISADTRFFDKTLPADEVKKVWESQKQKLQKIKPVNASYLEVRRELLRDLTNAKQRDVQMTAVTWAAFGGLFVCFVFLAVMWLVIRRWILVPTEKMLDFTQKIETGDLSARVPISPKASKSDEMDLLARDLNKMAASIQEALQKTREGQLFLQKLIDTLPDGVRVVDSDFNVVMTNKTHERQFGHLNLQNCGKCFEQMGQTAPCPQTVNTCPLRMLRQNPDKNVKVIHKYPTTDGREKFFEISAGFLNFHDRTLMLEVSRSLDKEIQFSHQQKLSSLGLLVGSVAHEMRNPLGSIQLILENIAGRTDSKPLSPEETKHYLNMILDQVQFCITVTTRLLKLARKPSEEALTVDLNEIVPETVSLLEYEAKKRGIDVTIKLNDAPVTIKASDTEMRMVLVNLAQNAFHAMRDGGTLSIETSADGKNAVLRVADTGCGIPPENIQRIFEPFFSNNQENKESGTGLGLSIVKSIVESAGGKISVESTVGQGTVFTFVFAEEKR